MSLSPSGGATIRADLSGVLEEAQALDTKNIGLRILPVLGVDAKSGTYPRLTKNVSELGKAGSTERAPRGSYGRNSRKWTTDNYDTVDYGHEEALDDVDRKDLSRFFDASATMAKLCRRVMSIDQEIRIAGAIQNTTNFGAATNSAVAYTTANDATTVPHHDLLDSIERVRDQGEEPNTIVMSSKVLQRIKRSTLFQNFIRGGAKASDADMMITSRVIQQAFADEGITQVLIGRAVYDNAKKGQNYSSTAVWNNTHIWVGNVTGGDIQAGGAGRTLAWNQEGGLLVAEQYRDEDTRSDIIRVRNHVSEKITNGDAGDLIATQYA